MAGEDGLQLNGSCTELMERQDAELPTLIRNAGVAARFAFEEFLHGKIRNLFTRKAYLHAVKRFSDWCVERQLDLVRVAPADVGRYLDAMMASTPTRKLHLAALRRFFDELVMRHVVILNPALSVRTERHQAVEGKTPEISIQQALETAHSLLPISAARRPPAIEACLLPCSSCDYLFPSKSFHPLNFLLRFLPCSLL